MLLASGVDIVNVADAPRAMARMSNLAFCSLLLERYGIQPILHVCGRDRNLLGQMAHLLGAHAIGIRNLVIITGDPPKVGDYPEATAVYDLDAIGLLQMAANMNRGIDPAGKPLPGGQTSFLLATGFEPGAADLDKEIQRLERKKAAGAEIVMTQPVFQTDLLEQVLRRIAPLEMPVLVGVLPLVSYKNAEFLHNEVPGMQIPEAIRERMRKTPGGEAARKEGVKIAREMLFAVRDRVQGAYLMPPLGRYELALEGARRPEALDPRGRLQRLPEHRQRARDVGLVVHDRDVDLAAALQHAVAQAHLVEPPQLGAVGGHDGAVVDDRLVGEDDIEDGRLAHHLRDHTGLLHQVGEAGHEASADGPHALVDAGLAELGQRGEPGHRGDRVAVERARLRDVLGRAVVARVEVPHDAPRGPPRRPAGSRRPRSCRRRPGRASRRSIPGRRRRRTGSR